ncbi:hypothetical protein D3C77_398120 [compost metagenome]
MSLVKKKNGRRTWGVLGILSFLIPLGLVEAYFSKQRVEQRVNEKLQEKVIHAIKAAPARGETEITIWLPPAD